MNETKLLSNRPEKNTTPRCVKSGPWTFGQLKVNWIRAELASLCSALCRLICTLVRQEWKSNVYGLPFARLLCILQSSIHPQDPRVDSKSNLVTVMLLSKNKMNVTVEPCPTDFFVEHWIARGGHSPMLPTQVSGIGIRLAAGDKTWNVNEMASRPPGSVMIQESRFNNGWTEKYDERQFCHAKPKYHLGMTLLWKQLGWFSLFFSRWCQWSSHLITRVWVGWLVSCSRCG